MEKTKKINEPVCAAEHTDEKQEQAILSQIPKEDIAVDAAALFSQLSDSTRIRLLSILSLGGLCVCEIAHILNMSQPAVSHHLRSLRQCGIVRFKKSGKRAVYYLNQNETGTIVKDMIADVCRKLEEQNGTPESEQQ